MDWIQDAERTAVCRRLYPHWCHLVPRPSSCTYVGMFIPTRVIDAHFICADFVRHGSLFCWCCLVCTTFTCAFCTYVSFVFEFFPPNSLSMKHTRSTASRLDATCQRVTVSVGVLSYNFVATLLTYARWLACCFLLSPTLLLYVRVFD